MASGGAKEGQPASTSADNPQDLLCKPATQPAEAAPASSAREGCSDGRPLAGLATARPSRRAGARESAGALLPTGTLIVLLIAGAIIAISRWQLRPSAGAEQTDNAISAAKPPSSAPGFGLCGPVPVKDFDNVKQGKFSSDRGPIYNAKVALACQRPHTGCKP